MSNQRVRTYFPRDPRLDSDPGDRNFVRFASLFGREQSSAAQFANISTTGMRLISRYPAKTVIGQDIDVHFTLPGTRREVSGRAHVVRIVNEFEFAVAFKTLDSRALQYSLNDYSRYLRMSPLARLIGRFGEWVREHRRGLAVALAGIAVFGMACAWIYSNSDEHVGRHLRSWANPYPKQWDLDYVNKK